MAKVVCVFGDSISQGFFDLGCGGWVEKLKMYFMKRGGDEFTFVYNLGVETNTSDDLLLRLEGELERRINILHVDKKWIYSPFVVFAIGKNDSVFVGDEANIWVNIEKFEKNLNELIDKSKKFTNNIIFIGLGNVDESKTIPLNEEGENYSNKNLLKYNNIIEKVCEENNLGFIPICGLLDIEKDLFDGVHPNEVGHRKIFEKILPVVEGMIGGIKT